MVVWILSAAYVFGFIDRGWIPHDEGSLGQMAERVLNGELPHKDFDEIYTGGLSFLYAAAFKTFGVSLISIRIVFYCFFLIFVPALYWIALRFASPLVAAAITLLGVAWSVPNYFAGMPSWYNLFFAVLGSAAIIRHIETQQARWLFIAGLCGGLSILAKVSGIFYVAAAFLFLLYREQILSSSRGGSEAQSSLFFIIKTVACCAFLAALTWVLWPHLGPAEAFQYLVPGACLCAFLLWKEHVGGQGTLACRIRALAGLVVPLLSGMSIPLGVFLVPYALTGSVGDLYAGVFVLSQKRLRYETLALPPLITLITVLPYGLLLLLNVSRSEKPLVDRIFAAAVAVGLVAVLISSGVGMNAYQFSWQSARALSIVAVLAGCLLILRDSTAGASKKQQVLVLLMLVTSLDSFIQFPFPAPIYYCYVAPLVAVTLLGIVSLEPNAPSALHLSALGFYFLFAVAWMNTSYLNVGLGYSYSPYRADSRLETSRSGIRLTADESHTYSQVISLVRQHATSGYIYASPDCPEVYFLAGLQNPTRKIFEF